MNELSQHIEYLLIEHDCVALPGLGGFVAHYSEATWDERNHTFQPPVRHIGFNPQIKLNDGLLEQSYMEVYGTDFGDAQKRVRRGVEQLKEQLFEEGQAELPNVGELRMSIRGTYDFTPYDHRLISPWLYGLGVLEVAQLAEVTADETLSRPLEVTTDREEVAVSGRCVAISGTAAEGSDTSVASFGPSSPEASDVASAAVAALFASSDAAHEAPTSVQRPARNSRRMRSRRTSSSRSWMEWEVDFSAAKRTAMRLAPEVMKYAAAVVVIVVTFFFYSSPVKNTEVVKESYAQLMPDQLFNCIQHQSLTTQVVQLSSDDKSGKPVAVERASYKKPNRPASEAKSATAVTSKSAVAPETTTTPKRAAATTATNKSASAPAAKSSTPAAKTSAPAAKSSASASSKPTSTKSASTKPAADKSAAMARTARPASATTSSEKTYHLIVASLPTEQEAQKIKDQLVAQGFAQAQLVIRDGKHRVSLQHFASQAEAYSAVNRLREQGKFEGAWIFSCSNR